MTQGNDNRILVTGAAGFVGYHLARKLAESPRNQIYCVDNFVRGEWDEAYTALSKQPNVEAIECDLTDAAAVRALPSGMDRIYHFAALNGTQNFYERPFEVVRCCTLPTMHLLEKYGPAGLKRFIYAGTSEAYAATVTRFGWEIPTGEDVPLSFDDVHNARWSYGASKMHGEIATINAGRHFRMPYSIIRIHNTYGPRMGDKHVIPDFLTRAKDGVFALYGHEETRSFIYVDDAVAATILIGESPACEGQIVNVGGSEELTMLSLADHLMRIGGFKGEIKLYPAPEGSVRRRAAKLDLLRKLTGFRESWTLEKGLRRTAEFYLGRPLGGP
jgi:nucleoside-diphosphate-sugar epimerase